MTRTAYGAALALLITVVLAPSASADVTTGGTPITGVPTAAAPVAAPTVSATRTVTLTRSQTRSVQRRVKVRPDGRIGAKTRTALRRYQAQRKLSRTGRPNLQTLRAMRLGFADTIERRMTSTAHAAQPSATPAALVGAIAAAQTAIGTPYRYGGTTTSGFDCSGLTVWAFRQAGVTLPRTSFQQYRLGTAISQEQIQPGDLVFFSSAGPGASHVGVATGPTTVISATNSGVMEHRIDDSYWGGHYVGARRIAAG